MATSMKDNGKTIKITGKEPIRIPTVHFMKGNGAMICNMDKEYNNIRTARLIEVITSTGSNKERANLSGPINLGMRGISNKIKSKEKETMENLMEQIMQETG
jgi:hypothetical protein